MGAGRDGAAGAPCGRSGFTLIELMVVVALLGIVLAVVAPRLGLVEDGRMRSTVRRLTGLVTYLGDSAETKKRYYRLWFDIDGERVRVEVSHDAVEFVPAADAALRPFELEGAEIVDVVVAGLGKAAGGEVSTVFAPYGGSLPFKLHVEGAGRVVTIGYNPYTARVELSEGYV